MKTLCLCVALASAAPAAAQTAEPTNTTTVQRQWTVSVDPLTLVLGFVHLQVERAFGRHLSLYVSPSLRLFDSLLGFPTGDFRGYGVEFGLRGFVWGAAPTGVWLMLRGVLADVVYTDGAQFGGYTSVLAGYTGIIGPGLVLSGGLGLSWFDYGRTGPNEGIHGFIPAAHTAIGWAW